MPLVWVGLACAGAVGYALVVVGAVTDRPDLARTGVAACVFAALVTIAILV